MEPSGECSQSPDMEGCSVSVRMMLMLSVAVCLRSSYEHGKLLAPGSTKKPVDGALGPSTLPTLVLHLIWGDFPFLFFFTSKMQIFVCL